MTGQFRLAGFGGAAVFFDARPALAQLYDTGGPRLALDISLLDPQHLMQWYDRPVGAEFVSELATFFFRAADDLHPESTLASFQDAAVAMSVSVRASTDTRVELEVTMYGAPEADDEIHGLIFETSRAALVSAARSMLELDGSPPQFDAALEGLS